MYKILQVYLHYRSVPAKPPIVLRRNVVSSLIPHHTTLTITSPGVNKNPLWTVPLAFLHNIRKLYNFNREKHTVCIMYTSDDSKSTSKQTSLVQSSMRALCFCLNGITRLALYRLTVWRFQLLAHGVQVAHPHSPNIPAEHVQHPSSVDPSSGPRPPGH